MKQVMSFIMLISLLVSCVGQEAANEQIAEQETQPVAIAPGKISSCPYLTTDNKGNPVLCWVQQETDTGEAVMAYAISRDEGKTFGDPVIISSSKKVHPHEENLPKIIFKPSGEIIAVFGASNPNPNNKYSGLVYYTQSFDEGKTWSDAALLVKDTASYDQRYFDIALLPDGEVGISWLDNRKQTEKEGSTLYYARTKGRNGFEDERSVAETVCQCCRTDLYIDEKKNIHISFRDIINDSIRDMMHTVSSDEGRTFTNTERISPDNWKISGCPHTGPTTGSNKEGLHFAWYTMGNGEGVFYCRSADNGKTFTPRESVSRKGSAKHPQLAIMPDGKIVIVWDEAMQKGDKYNNWIGMQVRDEKGNVLKSEFITPDSAVASFPVIIPVQSIVLVAYTLRTSTGDKVHYQKLSPGLNQP